MNDKAELSKLRWKCRRGTKELDLMMNYYLDQYYDEANKAEKAAFQHLLNRDDPKLMALILEENSSSSNNDEVIVLNKIRMHVV